MPTTLEVDFGWWSLPRSFQAYRLSWDIEDKKLRLFEGGDTRFVIRLGSFADEAAVRYALEGWQDAPLDSGRFGRDGRWLASRFPTCAKTLLGES